MKQIFLRASDGCHSYKDYFTDQSLQFGNGKLPNLSSPFFFFQFSITAKPAPFLISALLFIWLHAEQIQLTDLLEIEFL